jgi:HprK-related kinase A
LRGDGVRIHVGPYVYSIQSPLPLIQQGLEVLYGDFHLAGQTGFADFHVALRPANRVQQLRRKIDFYLDGQTPFSRIEARHAFAFLEWGMNWCVSVCANEYLKLHSAVLAKDGIAMIMPGLPGAGKSTLCAALALRGWRVLSDEHALVELDSADIVPLYRPVSLKNESIQVMNDFADEITFGPRTEETHKGVVVHMKADHHPASHEASSIPARLMLFPEYKAGSPLMIKPRTRAESFMFAAHHSFNYSLLSKLGFSTLTRLMDSVECFDLRYSNLDEAMDAVEQLHGMVIEK